jgi:hypothetical protein
MDAMWNHIFFFTQTLKHADTYLLLTGHGIVIASHGPRLGDGVIDGMNSSLKSSPALLLQRREFRSSPFGKGG